MARIVPLLWVVAIALCLVSVLGAKTLLGYAENPFTLNLFQGDGFQVRARIRTAYWLAVGSCVLANVLLAVAVQVGTTRAKLGVCTVLVLLTGCYVLSLSRTASDLWLDLGGDGFP